MKKKIVKKKAGRPPGPGKRGHRGKIEIDFNLLKKMCQIQCTAEEIAGVMEISSDTLNARIKEKHDITFSEYYKKYSDEGKTSLRRLQFKIAQTNPGMAIFLGKQYLRQRDKQEIIEITDEALDAEIEKELEKRK